MENFGKSGDFSQKSQDASPALSPGHFKRHQLHVGY